MAERKPVRVDPGANLGFLTGIINQFRLVWMLMQDGQVPLWAKSIVPLAVLYIISPIDVIPDVVLGLGQLDDLGVILAGIALFVKMCPPSVVEYYKRQLASGSDPDDEALDTTYRVMDEE